MSNLIGFDTKKPKHPKTGIVIQARMTSKRFPGKSMALLHGKPVVQHVIEAAQRVVPCDVIILAVPDTPESDPLIELASNLGVENFCGSELNVLDRYYQAAKFFKLEIIMRLTGDCPFLVPKICSEVVQLLLWRKLDYSCNCFPERTFPKGLDCEAFTFDLLEAAHTLADPLKPGDFEHVTPFMQRVDGIKRACVRQSVDASKENWCIDFPEDLERLEALPKRTYVGKANDN